MIMGLAYVTSPPPHFCDVILSKLCFNCLHSFYAMLTVRPFIPCSARHFKKGAKFAGSVGHLMTKMLSAFRGASPPDPLTRGSAPGPRWGLCLQTPVIGSCSALAMVPRTPSAAYHPRASSPPPLILTSLRLWQTPYRFIDPACSTYYTYADSASEAIVITDKTNKLLPLGLLLLSVCV